MPCAWFRNPPKTTCRGYSIYVLQVERHEPIIFVVLSANREAGYLPALALCFELVCVCAGAHVLLGMKCRLPSEDLIPVCKFFTAKHSETFPGQHETSGLMHLQGPPGTGKTRTLHALILAVVACDEALPRSRSRHGQVLAIAGTNAAADNLLQGLVGQLRVWSPLLHLTSF